MRRSLCVAKLICAAALGLLAAQESEAVTLLPTAGGGYTASFVSNPDGSFLDTFTFTPSTVAGEVMVDLMPTGPVTFFTALLNGQGFAYLPENGKQSFDFTGIVGTDQPLQLQVFGFSGDATTLSAMPGSYAGSIVITEVPEPANLALWLAGAAIVYGLTRRRHGAAN